MEFAVISLMSVLWKRAIPAMFVLLISAAALGQSIQLSPAQQQMLDQLPAAQREQALRQIELLQQQGADNSQVPGLLGDTTDLMPSFDLPVVEEEAEELRAERRSRVIVTLELEEDLERQQVLEFERDEALKRVAGSRYYELDDAGVLNLPGLPSIPLLGLTAEQIEQRLNAEPDLNIFVITATILESTTTGVDALEPFGYDLFEAKSAGGYDPVTTGPVPPDYVLGPGAVFMSPKSHATAY
jgi:hypothetical protein